MAEEFINRPDNYYSEPIFRLMIVGTRTFNDYHLLYKKCTHFLANHMNVEIVSGGCTGADALAKRFAIDCGYAYKEFPADWGEYGKAAGPIRNRQMCEYIKQSDNCGIIAFWDGKSKGTKNDIEFAEELGIPIKVIKI